MDTHLFFSVIGVDSVISAFIDSFESAHTEMSTSGGENICYSVHGIDKKDVVKKSVILKGVTVLN